jgi:hypothetical protein
MTRIGQPVRHFFGLPPLQCKVRLYRFVAPVVWAVRWRCRGWSVALLSWKAVSRKLLLNFTI